jgi:hypothetical protein
MASLSFPAPVGHCCANASYEWQPRFPFAGGGRGDAIPISLRLGAKYSANPVPLL